MSDEFASPTGINWQGTTGVVQYGGGDQSMVVMFYNRPCHNPSKSAEAGRPIYEDKVYARIGPPGERLNIVDRPMQRSDTTRWPIQWAQFQQQKEQHPEGTPIDLLFPDHPSIAAMLRASSVQTIEQCAELSGTAIDAIGMGSQRYVNAAQEYIKKANKGVGIAQHRRELEERDREINALKSMVGKMQTEMERLRTETPSVTPEQIQSMIAGAMQRPQFMGMSTPPRSFDAASAQIAANHPTAEVARQRKPKHRERAT